MSGSSVNDWQGFKNREQVIFGQQVEKRLAILETQARLRAESTNYYNLKGYLATITSEEEQLFIRNKIEDPILETCPIWLGGRI